MKTSNNFLREDFKTFKPKFSLYCNKCTYEIKKSSTKE